MGKAGQSRGDLVAVGISCTLDNGILQVVAEHRGPYLNSSTVFRSRYSKLVLTVQHMILSIRYEAYFVLF